MAHSKRALGENTNNESNNIALIGLGAAGKRNIINAADFWGRTGYWKPCFLSDPAASTIQYFIRAQGAIRLERLMLHRKCSSMSWL
jgi:hypothetical protein